MHPFLNSAVDASKYEVDVSAPVIFHQAPPRDGSPVGGLWAWSWPCLGVNVYADGILMERSVAASEITTEEDRKICEAVQRNLDAGIYESGRLSPKHEQGVAWFQNQLRRTLQI